MKFKSERVTAIGEFQRATWEDDGGAGLSGPRTVSRVPHPSPGSPEAATDVGRAPLDRTSRRPRSSLPPAVL